MAQAEINILMTLKDEASKVLKGFSGSLGGSFSDAQKGSMIVAGALGAVAAGAAVFGVTAVKAAASAQAEMSQFETMIKNTKGSTEEAKNQMLEAAKAAVRLGFDDEAAAVSMAKFYQRTGDVTQAIKLNTLAMDLSRNKNIDLESAMKMVNLVLSGNGRLLKQYGIDIKDSATPLEALKTLQDQVGGSAQSFSKTYQGNMDAFKVTFQNFQEMVGEKILPMLTRFLSALTPVLEKFTEWSSNLKNLNKFLDDHYLAISLIGGALLGALVPALISLATTVWVTVIPAIIAMAVSLAPFILTGLIVGGIVAGVIWIVKHWTMLKDTAMSVFTAVKDFFVGIWDDIKRIFQEAIDYLMKKIQPFLDAVNKVISGAKSVGSAIGKGVSSAASTVGGWLGINDGIVQNGRVITTHPDDYIIATKTPGSLRGGGGVTINIGTMIGDSEYANKMGDMIIKKLQMQFSI